jgi:GT2 family glycosyltransferase
VSAVTGACLAIRRDVFAQLNGFDTAFPVNYNDADLCLRARAAGYEVIFEPAATLRHDECATRRAGTKIEEREEFWQRWGDLLERPDPYFTPFLEGEEMRLVWQ